MNKQSSQWKSPSATSSLSSPISSLIGRPGVTGGGGGGALHFALSRQLRLASAMTHIDANVTERTQKADIRLCLQPRSSGLGGGEAAVHLKHHHFHYFHWTQKKKLPALSQTRLSVTQLFPATQWTQQLLQGHWEEQLFLFFFFFSWFSGCKTPPLISSNTTTDVAWWSFGHTH